MKQSILDLIGEPAALEQLAEEAAELAQAALKLVRVLRDENPTPVTEDKARGDLTNEFTDVIACSVALGLHEDPDVLAGKIKRWYQRLEAKGDDNGTTD